MKILVIDDNVINQDSARQTLIGHDVNVVGTHEDAHEVLVKSEPYDAVLCDLLMPAGRMAQGPNGKKYVGQEMPVGFGLALLAVLRGAKLVLVATATNHHDHPAAAMFDHFRDKGKCLERQKGWAIPAPHRFSIDGTRVAYFHAIMTFVEGSVCLDCNGSGEKDACYCTRESDHSKPDCSDCGGKGRKCRECQNSGKQWGKDWGAMLQYLLAV